MILLMFRRTTNKKRYFYYQFEPGEHIPNFVYFSSSITLQKDKKYESNLPGLVYRYSVK